MTSPGINSNSRPTRPFHLITAVAALALAALLVASHSSAKSNKVDGVRAATKHGTLNVKGGDGGQQVALRLKAGDSSRIQVDAGDNGSADVQIALLSEEIKTLTEHFKVHRKDYTSRRGLLLMVGARSKLLKFLRNRTPDRYQGIVQRLGLRR